MVESGVKKKAHFTFVSPLYHKITINEHETLIAAEQVNYIINRYKGKAAAHLKADLRKGIFDGNPEYLINFLKDLFNDPYCRDKAL